MGLSPECEKQHSEYSEDSTDHLQAGEPFVEESPSAVQGAIHRLMSDGDLRERLGRAARKEIIQNYSLDDAVSQELQAYRSVVK